MASALVIAPARGDSASLAISLLPEVLTQPTEFTVTPDFPACRVRYGSTVRTEAPWTFTIPFTAPMEMNVTASPCDGSAPVTVTLPATLPWSVSSSFIQTELFSQALATTHISLFSRIPEDATAVLTRDGLPQAVISVAGNSVTDLELPLVRDQAITTFALQLTSASETTLTLPIVMTRWWSTMRPNTQPVFLRCSTVTWHYNPSDAPRRITSASVRADLREAFRRVAAETGLQFIESPDTTGQHIAIGWSRRTPGPGEGNTAAQATYSVPWDGPAIASITLYTSNWMMRNPKYRGFGIVKLLSPPTRDGLQLQWGNRTAGRGWVLLHEVMHTVGLGHTSTPTQVMYPELNMQHRLGVGDLAGLHYLYPSRQCSQAARGQTA